MIDYKTPGVYIEEIDSLPRAVSGVATAIPVFIGYTLATDHAGEHSVPKRISSFLEYTHNFGEAPKSVFKLNVNQKQNTAGAIIETIITDSAVTSNVVDYNMYYAIQMYFANGGGPCYILSVGEASGSYSDFDKDDFFNILKNYDEPTLLVLPDSVKHTDHKGVIEAGLKHCGEMQDRFLISDVVGAISGNADPAALAVTYRELASTPDLKYGAAYFPYLKTSLSHFTSDTSIEITLHTILDSNGAPVTAVIDPDTSLDLIPEEFRDLYFAAKQYVETKKVEIPASSSIAGIYVDTDAKRGVWKSPANVGIRSVIGPSIPISNDLNDNLNDDPSGKSINAIRSFTGKGTMVWGARTLDAGNLNWRFINVRREAIYIEESIKKALEHYVFESNTANTWVKVKTTITSFLTSIWKAGGLAGERAEDAFDVSIGLNLTMTPIEVAEGKMIVEIRLAMPRPAEVIIFRVSQKLQTS